EGAHHLVLESGDPALRALHAALHDLRRAGLLGQQVDVTGQVVAGLVDFRPQPRGLFAHWASSFRVSTVSSMGGVARWRFFRPLAWSTKATIPQIAATMSAAQPR